MAFNTKDMIKSKLPNDSVTTLSPPEPTSELANVEKLNSKNLVGDNNTPLPENIKDKKIAEGVDQNTPDIVDCITQKVKDLIGVFTVPFGVASLDQFNTSSIDSIGQAFTDSLASIKESFTNTVDGIKGMFKSKKQNNIDQVETGGLSLKKFLGCQEANVQFTPRERVQAQKQPAIITNKIETGTKESQEALATQANKNVKQRTEPPAQKSKQVDVPTNTEVENIPPIPWDYYNFRIYKTPVAEPLTAENKQMLTDAKLDVSDSISDLTDPVGFLTQALKRTVDASYGPLLDLIYNKDKTPNIALYDPVELNIKQTAYDNLPPGYLQVMLTVKNNSYSTVNSKKTSNNTYLLTSKYKSTGTKPYNKQIENTGLGNTYTRADVHSIDKAMKGPNIYDNKSVSPLLRDVNSSNFKF